MGREMPLSRGRQQPTSERRKGDRMSGLTQWEVTCGGWTEAAHSRASGPARVSAPYVLICSVLSEAHDGFSTKHRHVGLFPKNGCIWRYLFQPGTAPASTLLTNCYPRGRCSCRYEVLCAGPQGLSTGL